MKALIWKDLRLASGPFLVIVLFFIAIPFVVLWAQVIDRGWSEAMRPGNLAGAIVMASFGALGASVIVIPAIAGVAFARERRDRSADYLASLPVPRLRIVASKMLATLLHCAWPWVVPFVVALLLSGPDASFDANMRETLGWILTVYAMLFGLAWLASAISRSDVIAAAVAIFAGLLLLAVYITFRVNAERYSTNRELAVDSAAFHTAYSVGIAGFLAGTTIALRRTSP